MNSCKQVWPSASNPHPSTSPTYASKERGRIHEPPTTDHGRRNQLGLCPFLKPAFSRSKIFGSIQGSPVFPQGLGAYSCMAPFPLVKRGGKAQPFNSQKGFKGLRTKGPEPPPGSFIRKVSLQRVEETPRRKPSFKTPQQRSHKTPTPKPSESSLPQTVRTPSHVNGRSPMGPTLGRSKSNAEEAFDRTLTSCQSLVPTSIDHSGALPCNRQGGLFGPVWSRRALGVTTGVHYIAFYLARDP